MKQVPQVLTIAGVDSGGGAGIQADSKTFHQQEVFATNIVVALTAQNTLGVQQTLGVPLNFVQEQFHSIRQDFNIQAVKTGMLFDAEHTHLISQELSRSNFGPLVVDPVMIAKGGHPLLEDQAIETIKSKLLPLTTLLTPNLPEAERLVGYKLRSLADIVQSARDFQNLGVKNIIIKGGHRTGDTALDYVLLENGHSFQLQAPRIDTNNTHGTGDTYSAAITAQLAKGKNMKSAIVTARQFLQNAIEKDIQIGHGHGPLNHWVRNANKTVKVINLN